MLTRVASHVHYAMSLPLAWSGAILTRVASHIRYTMSRHGFVWYRFLPFAPLLFALFPPNLERCWTTAKGQDG